MTSLDGKATGSFWGKKSVQTGMKEYFRIQKEKLNAQAMAYGRKTFETFSVYQIQIIQNLKIKKYQEKIIQQKKVKIVNIIMLYMIQMEN